MAFSSFHSLFSKPHFALVFDINSASVGVAVVKYAADESVTIHATHREPIAYGDSGEAHDLGAYLQNALERAGAIGVEKLGKTEGFKEDYTVHAIVHAPWVHSESEHVEEAYDQPVPITKKHLKERLEALLPIEAEEGRMQFDRHVTRISLNGYTTNDPYGNEAHQIGITALKSSMVEVIYESILAGFKNVVPNHDVHIDPFIFAALQLNDFFDFNDAFTTIDIGGEYTTIHVIRDGTVAESSWAAFGTQHLLRAIGGEDLANRGTAHSQLVMFLDNTCTPSQCRRIEQQLEPTSKEWETVFVEACRRLTQTHKVPTHTYVSVDSHYAAWFLKAIDNPNFSEFTVTGQPLRSELLSVRKSERPLHYSGSARRDTLLGLAALFVDK